MSDASADGRRLRVHCILEASRERLCPLPLTLLSGVQLTGELDLLMRRLGRPDLIFRDNGTGITRHIVRPCCQETGVNWRDTAPGKPMQNALDESCNGACGTNA